MDGTSAHTDITPTTGAMGILRTVPITPATPTVINPIMPATFPHTYPMLEVMLTEFNHTTPVTRTDTRLMPAPTGQRRSRPITRALGPARARSQRPPRRPGFPVTQPPPPHFRVGRCPHR